MSIGTMIKQPADQVDYDVDFSKWIPQGDTLTMAAVTAELAMPAPTIDEDAVPLVIESYELHGLIVKVWARGGQDGESYKVTVVAATEQGRVKETEFRVRVRNF